VRSLTLIMYASAYSCCIRVPYFSAEKHAVACCCAQLCGHTQDTLHSCLCNDIAISDATLFMTRCNHVSATGHHKRNSHVSTNKRGHEDPAKGRRMKICLVSGVLGLGIVTALHCQHSGPEPRSTPTAPSASNQEASGIYCIHSLPNHKMYRARCWHTFIVPRTALRLSGFHRTLRDFCAFHMQGRRCQHLKDALFSLHFSFPYLCTTETCPCDETRGLRSCAFPRCFSNTS
jgi:hypothetical protein